MLDLRDLKLKIKVDEGLIAQGSKVVEYARTRMGLTLTPNHVLVTVNTLHGIWIPWTGRLQAQGHPSLMFS